MQLTMMGLIAGLALGIATVIGDFSGFAITAVLGAIGLLVGLVLDGELDLGGLADKARQKQ